MEKKRLPKKYKTYFLLNEDTGLDVKIGRSSNPRQRISIIQPGNHSRLKLLATLDEDKEKELHKKFSKYRVLGEWFRYEGELREYIEKIIAMDGDSGINE